MQYSRSKANSSSLLFHFSNYYSFSRRALFVTIPKHYLLLFSSLGSSDYPSTAALIFLSTKSDSYWVMLPIRVPLKNASKYLFRSILTHLGGSLPFPKVSRTKNSNLRKFEPLVLLLTDLMIESDSAIHGPASISTWHIMNVLAGVPLIFGASWLGWVW